MISDENVEMELIFLLVFSFLVTATVAWIISNYAVRWGLVDLPTDRGSHLLPTPRGGGFGILFVFATVGFYLSFPWSFMLPVLVLGGVSFLDDRYSVPVRVRLILQILLAMLAISGTAQLLDHGGLINVGLFLFLTLYVVSTANFFNFMDGINGMAGGMGAVVFLLIAVFALLQDAGRAEYTLALCLVLSCLGFLPFNIPQAKIFMGDVGSVSLGFTAAVMTVSLSHEFADFVCLLSFLFIFYADAITTLWVRWRDRENLAQPHRRHLYQLLSNEMGKPHYAVSMQFALVQIIIGFLMILAWSYSNILLQLCLLAVFGIVFVVVTCWCRKTICR